MKHLIIHQIFWTLVSFSLFYLIVNRALNQLREVMQTRKSEIEKLRLEIMHYQKKVQSKKDESHHLYAIEIPAKINAYVDTSLTPIIAENAQTLENLTKKSIKPVEITGDKKLKEFAELLRKKRGDLDAF